MKNAVTLQLRALRPPREIRDTVTGWIESFDIWGLHRVGESSRTWAIGVKCLPHLLPEIKNVRSGTLLTIFGRLDLLHHPDSGIHAYVIWADRVSISASQNNPTEE